MYLPLHWSRFVDHTPSDGAAFMYLYINLFINCLFNHVCYVPEGYLMLSKFRVNSLLNKEYFSFYYHYYYYRFIFVL